MFNLKTKIKVYLLLIIFLSVCFPIQEFFHEHHFIEECSSNHPIEHHNEFDTLNQIQKKCDHEHHISEKKDKDFCFLIHVSKNYTPYHYTSLNFNSKEVVISYIEKTSSLYFCYALTKYLRGPPSIL